jgi:hypothetical protein
MKDQPGVPEAPDKASEQGGYEPPRILWSEPYEPLSFGVSCAKQPGNPGCNPGPFSS